MHVRHLKSSRTRRNRLSIAAWSMCCSWFATSKKRTNNSSLPLLTMWWRYWCLRLMPAKQPLNKRFPPFWPTLLTRRLSVRSRQIQALRFTSSLLRRNRRLPRLSRTSRWTATPIATSCVRFSSVTLAILPTRRTLPLDPSMWVSTLMGDTSWVTMLMWMWTSSPPPIQTHLISLPSR